MFVGEMVDLTIIIYECIENGGWHTTVCDCGVKVAFNVTVSYMYTAHVIDCVWGMDDCILTVHKFQKFYQLLAEISAVTNDI